MGPLYVLQAHNRVPPLKVTVELDSHPVSMEVDTGAAYSLVSEATYREIWSDKRLDKCDVSLCTYSGESIEVRLPVKRGKRNGMECGMERGMEYGMVYGIITW